MKITNVKTFMCATNRQNWLFVKVETDKGLFGWGEASVEGQEKATEECIKVLAERSVIGEDPGNIDRIWQKMYRHGFWKSGFIHMSAISGIDQALWDLMGKMYNVPVYKLLGGAVRDKVLTYTHARNGDDAARAIDNGFAGVKTGGGKAVSIHDPAGDPGALAERLKDIRDCIGYDKVLCIDNHGQSAPIDAIQKMVAALPYKIHFFEEPIPPENTSSYNQLRNAVPTMPIAAGERLFSRFDFREVVQDKLFDTAQPDVCHCGGISEIMKIAHMVEPFHIKIAPHNPNGPVATAASLHVCAAIQNFDILEFATHSVYQREDVYKNLNLKPKDGYFALPEGPGLGVDLDEEAIAKYPYVNKQYDPRFMLDGTVAEI